MYLYVLKLENECYYVGITKNKEIRMREHFEGVRFEWTKLNKPIEIIEERKIKETRYLSLLGIEKMTTMKYMVKYGIDKVRGGPYTEIILSPRTVRILQKMIDKGRCFRCRRRSHHVDECTEICDKYGEEFYINSD